MRNMIKSAGYVMVLANVAFVEEKAYYNNSFCEAKAEHLQQTTNVSTSRSDNAWTLVA